MAAVREGERVSSIALALVKLQFKPDRQPGVVVGSVNIYHDNIDPPLYQCHSTSATFVEMERLHKAQLPFPSLNAALGFASQPASGRYRSEYEYDT
jgi:hypothetical protein